ncbi:MAG: GNAT family N-acetyltransferase, partial [Propionibacteriales bacterium]|nr:GNAT family N-acetyltransferase [Propionibacteriales bacterium]
MTVGAPSLADVLDWQQTWPATEEFNCGGWRLRGAEGWTKRCNSALAAPSEVPIGELVERTAAFYRDRQLTGCIVEHDCLPVPGLAEELDSRGWRTRARDSVMAIDVAELAADHHEVVIFDSAAHRRPESGWDRWIEAYDRGSGGLPAVAHRVLLGSPSQLFAMVLDRDGTAVGVSRVGVARRWAGLNCVWVDPDHRGRGLATTMLEQLSAALTVRGIARLQLAVDHTNLTAATLYRHLGFH